MNYNYKNWRAISHKKTGAIAAEFKTEEELNQFLVRNNGYYKDYASDDKIKKERFAEHDNDRNSNLMSGIEIED